MRRYVIQLIVTDSDVPLYLIEVRPSLVGMYSYDKEKAIIFDSYEEAEIVYNKLQTNINVVIKLLK